MSLWLAYGPFDLFTGSATCYMTEIFKRRSSVCRRVCLPLDGCTNNARMYRPVTKRILIHLEILFDGTQLHITWYILAQSWKAKIVRGLNCNKNGRFKYVVKVHIHNGPSFFVNCAFTVNFRTCGPIQLCQHSRELATCCGINGKLPFRVYRLDNQGEGWLRAFDRVAGPDDRDLHLNCV
jgi:hypothetical protein